MISAIILAAGESRRMGEQNKLLLSFSGQVLIHKIVETVCNSVVDDVLVVLGYEAENIKAVLENLPVRFLENKGYEEGMTSSIQTGVRATAEVSQGLLICLADMPFVDKADLNRLVQAFTDLSKTESSLIIVPVFQGKRGNPVLFSSKFRDEILLHDGEGCRGILRKHQQSIREIEMDSEHVLLDVDTPEDYLLHS
ncbi:MAG: nucleotidyltransferase family protein [SAR324 cluster bacterium]|nr:nucleotidyltransferase family protein [SAR324 cluster bacterium]MBL7035046.1 nucleotidyltransferase family protein [SAR324 cluster bacterium]